MKVEPGWRDLYGEVPNDIVICGCGLNLRVTRFSVTLVCWLSTFDGVPSLPNLISY